MWETTSGYGNLSLVENSLAYLGILNVRDNFTTSSLSAFAALANQGYKLDFAIPSDAITITNFVAQMDAFNAAHPGGIKAIEGPNEVNIFPVTYNGGSSLANAAQYQQAFYSAVRADGHLNNIPVYNLSLAYLDTTQYAQVGDLSGSANYANSHAYLNNAYGPQWSLNIILPVAKLDAKSLPTVITETGYNTDPNDGYSGVNQSVQAKYTLDTLMDAYKDGVAATYLYELFDEFPDPSNTNAQNHYGIFNSDGSPKLAATAIHNLTTILADPSAPPSFTPGALNYSVSNLTAAYGNQLLLQKSSGVFDLVLWADPSVYRPSTDTEIAAPNDSVTVNFAQVEGTVTVFDPLLGTTPIASYHNVQQIQINVTDHPLVIEISNGSTPTAPTPATTVIESFGSTQLTEIANHFYLYNSAGSGPSLKYGGADVVDGQFGGWRLIGAEATSSGYDVAWKAGSADQYIVWGTDSNGNLNSYLANNVSGTSTTLESLETSFQQDLNGDGHIGLGTITTVIESYGSTHLTEIANHFYLYNSAGSGPSLKYGGADVVDGQFGAWTLIGAEATSSGYDVAWKAGSADQYTVWGTDNNGNLSSYLANNVSGASTTLQSLETSFHQDLNGDGVIGVPTTPSVIESFGATSLVAVGNNYFLDNSAGSGPELTYGSAPVAAGQFNPWTPIAAEQTSTGYEIAWHNTSTNQYTVWNTDSNGHYISNIGNVSGASSTLETLENSFHQDLNGDGVIGIPTTSGPPTTTIESFGSTIFTEVGNNYFLYDSTGSGPELKYSGANVVDGQFPGWTPIGAEQTSTGYEIAWYNANTNQFTVWNTDSGGKYISNIGNVSGTSSTLETLETSFHQDLNGDGHVGQSPSGAPSNDVLLVNPLGGTLTGGAGNDTFVFNLPPTTPSTITDFTSGQDHLQISAAGFGHGLTAGGTPTLMAGVPANVSHPGSDGYFIFDNSDPHGGTLYWDPTGGSGSDATAVVHLQNVALLHLSDFHLV